MKLKDLKEKLKNKVTQNKTTQFVVKHERDLTLLGIGFLVGGTIITLISKRAYKQGVMSTYAITKISSNTAARDIVGVEKAIEIANKAAEYETTTYNMFGKMKCSEFNKLLPNITTKMPTK